MRTRTSRIGALLSLSLLTVASCRPANDGQFIDAAAPLPATVLVMTSWNQGTGFLVDREDRLLVTSHYVIGAHEEAEVIYPALEDGKVKAKRDYYMKQAPRIKVKVVAVDPKRDLVFLQAASVPEEVQELKLSASVTADEPVHLALDSASRVQLWASRASTVKTVGPFDFTNPNGQRVIARMIELNLDGKFAKNNGGGPVVNDAGELVGVIAGNSVNRTQVVAIDPSEVKDFLSFAYRKMGTDAFNSTNYKQAVAYCDKALRYKPKDALTYNERGAALSYLEQYEDAIAAYTNAIKLDPRLVRAYRNRGSAYLHNKNYEQAVVDCTTALKLDPTYIPAYQTRILANTKLGKTDAARADTETIRELTKPIYKSVGTP
ncbi:MAG: serine protease [Gemmataceae bacterium]|nr:serine protease [Gemmataceae bacterium]